MWRIKLDEAGAADLQALRKDKTLRPAERDRVEMVALSVAGWKRSEIARHLGCCEETVRRAFRGFRVKGMQGLRLEPPGPEPDLARRTRVQNALRELLAQSRTWTAGQLAEELREQGINLSARQVRRYLSEIASWKRVKRSLSHKQDEVKVAQAKTELGLLANRPKQAN